MSTPTTSLSDHELKLLHSLIELSLQEDVHTGDVTTESTIPEESQSQAVFLAKEDGVLSGIEVAQIVFQKISPTLQSNFTLHDGSAVTKGTVFGTVKGNTRALLIAERLVLNIMQRMSGIATFTSHMVSLIDKSVLSLHHAQPTRLLDTRKTVPGNRTLDKLAVKHGGGCNHRIGLYDMVMIKDNHISASGGLSQAVSRVNDYLQRNNKSNVSIEVEARTIDEVREALSIGNFQRIMLDNMVKVNYVNGSYNVDTSMMREALSLINGKYETEASGNVNEHSIHAISQTGVDFISCGALTHTVKALDISLKIQTL